MPRFYFLLQFLVFFFYFEDVFEQKHSNLNMVDTLFTFIRTQKAEKRPVKYFLNDTQIEDVECFKYLGTNLDSRLNFHQHI